MNRRSFLGSLVGVGAALLAGFKDTRGLVTLRARSGPCVITLPPPTSPVEIMIANHGTEPITVVADKVLTIGDEVVIFEPKDGRWVCHFPFRRPTVKDALFLSGGKGFTWNPETGDMREVV